MSTGIPIQQRHTHAVQWVGQEGPPVAYAKYQGGKLVLCEKKDSILRVFQVSSEVLLPICTNDWVLFSDDNVPQMVIHNEMFHKLFK